MQDEYEAAANAILAAGMASDTGGTRTEWKFRAEFLEFDGSPGGCQLVVNAEKVGAPYTGSAGKMLAFNKDEIRPCMERLSELAEAIASAFNAIDGLRGDDPDAWYVHSECNWWHKDGEENDDRNGVTTIQWCIFNG